MLYFLYTLLLSLLIFFTLPFWVWKYFSTQKYKGTLQQRLGRDLPPLLGESGKPKIWLHAVSVGETIAAQGIVAQLSRRFPDHLIILSTVTKTGQQIAQEKIPKLAATFYLPVDLPWIVQPVVYHIKPQAFLVMETELWPNLFRALHREGIPVILVNGRLSPHSFRHYVKFRTYMTTFLQPVKLFAMQSPLDAQRMGAIGGRKERIVHTGNVKYDQALSIPTNYEMELLFQSLPRPKAPVWIAASTHPGEETIVLSVFRRLREQIPDLRLITVPRHPERAASLSDMIQKEGWSCRIMSEVQTASLDQPQNRGEWSEPILLVDQVGWLSRLYGYARVAFVGGSLIPHGGQNVLEPAAWSIPPLFGPHTFNFKDACQQILEAEGGIRVEDEDSLYRETLALLKSDARCQEMGAKAKQVVLSNAGALERTMNAIQMTIEGRFVS